MTSLPSLLVPSKMMAPQLRSSLVPRTRLIGQLDAQFAARLVLVVAPAGFGKSTLVAQWLAIRAARARPAAWVTLDEHDQDGLRFLRYVVGAINRVAPATVPVTESLLDAPEPPPLYVLIQSLLVDLSAAPDGLTLVLDDYHLINAESLHQAVAYLVRHLPEQCQIVLISRVDPPLSQARLRAERALGELRATDLRFSLDEAADLLARLHAAPPDSALVAALYQQTEGWAIALQLAALAQTTSSNRVIASRQIAEYFADEVLAQQAPELQQLLLTLSVPERFCAELAAALLTAPAQVLYAEHQLDELMRTSQLVLPLDAEGRWYCFHHLFRDLLLRRLRATLGEGEIRVLQSRAAHWLAAAEHTEEAARLFLAAGDEDAAAALIERQIVYNMERGATNSSIGTWLCLIPAQVIARRPGLSLIAGRQASLSLDLGALQTHMARVEQMLDASSNAPQALPWPAFAADRAALTGMKLVWQGDAANAVRHLQFAVANGTAIFPIGQVFLYVGLAYAGDGRLLDGVREMSRSLPDHDERMLSASERYHRYTSLCGMYLLAGELESLQRDAQHLAALVASARLGTITATYADYCLALVAYERSELGRAATYFSRLVQLKYQVNATTYIAAVVGMALTLIAQGSYADAAGYVAEATRFADEVGVAFLRHQALGCALRLALAQEDRTTALQIAALIGPDIHLGNSPWLETPRFSQARALIAAGDTTALAKADEIIAACLREIEELHLSLIHI